jgi:hypothetical protein
VAGVLGGLKGRLRRRWMVGHGKVLPIGSDASLLSLKIGLDNGGHFQPLRETLPSTSALGRSSEDSQLIQ